MATLNGVKLIFVHGLEPVFKIEQKTAGGRLIEPLNLRNVLLCNCIAKRAIAKDGLNPSVQRIHHLHREAFAELLGTLRQVLADLFDMPFSVGLVHGTFVKKNGEKVVFKQNFTPVVAAQKAPEVQENSLPAEQKEVEQKEPELVAEQKEIEQKEPELVAKQEEVEETLPELIFEFEEPNPKLAKLLAERKETEETKEEAPPSSSTEKLPSAPGQREKVIAPVPAPRSFQGAAIDRVKYCGTLVGKTLALPLVVGSAIGRAVKANPKTAAAVMGAAGLGYAVHTGLVTSVVDSAKTFVDDIFANFESIENGEIDRPENIYPEVPSRLDPLADNAEMLLGKSFVNSESIENRVIVRPENSYLEVPSHPDSLLNCPLTNRVADRIRTWLRESSKSFVNFKPPVENRLIVRSGPDLSLPCPPKSDDAVHIAGNLTTSFIDRIRTWAGNFFYRP